MPTSKVIKFKRSGYSGFHKGFIKQFMGARGALTVEITQDRLKIFPSGWTPGRQMLDLDVDIPLSNIQKIVKKRFLSFTWLDIHYTATNDVKVFTISGYWPFRKTSELADMFTKLGLVL